MEWTACDRLTLNAINEPWVREEKLEPQRFLVWALSRSVTNLSLSVGGIVRGNKVGARVAFYAKTKQRPQRDCLPTRQTKVTQQLEIAGPIPTRVDIAAH